MLGNCAISECPLSALPEDESVHPIAAYTVASRAISMFGRFAILMASLIGLWRPLC